MVYTVWWYRFPNGKETDEMVAKSRDFETFEKALAFLQGRLRLISSRHWAGGQIETSEIPCKLIYDVDWEGNEEDLRCEHATEKEQNQSTVSEPEQETVLKIQQSDEACSESLPESEQDEIPQEIKEIFESVIRPTINTIYKIADELTMLFSKIGKVYILAEDNKKQERPPPELRNRQRILKTESR